MTDKRSENPAGLPEPDDQIDDQPGDQIDDEPPVVCRKLRTKLAFGALQGVRDWRHGDSSTAVYWCLSTMETAGPDDGYAHPHGCRAGRACYVPPPGEEDGPALLALDGRRGPERG